MKMLKNIVSDFSGKCLTEDDLVSKLIYGKCVNSQVNQHIAKAL